MKLETYIREEIDARGETLKGFSERVGIPYTPMRSMLQNGIFKSSIDNVIKMSRGLGLSLSFIETAEKGGIDQILIDAGDALRSKGYILEYNSNKPKSNTVPRRLMINGEFYYGIRVVPEMYENEASLLKLLVHLSEEAVYKLVDEDKDVIFNMNSVYIKLLENENSIIDINGSKEPKGSLRILKSLLSDGMNPYINYSNTRGLELADGMKEELELYQCRVDASLSLLNTKYIVDQIDDKNESTYTIEVSEENELYGSRVSGGNNILLYGVPGSGKSYKIEKEYCNDFNFMERVVFHPDYMNTDFVGQILPTVKGEGEEKEITYDFTPGPFTRILKKSHQ